MTATTTTSQISTVHLAGYQGAASILTAALRELAQALEDSDWGLPVAFESDVTARGEKATELFASLESGERQIGYMASSYLSGRVPELRVLDLPFTVSDRGAALRALDGTAGELLREAVARESGFQVLAFWDNGFRHISNAVRPIRSPADCAGLVIRTLDNADYRAMLDSLGFTAVTTDVKELVHAVRSGAVQAQENPLTNLISFGLWRHHPHVSLSGHFFGVLLLVCPRDWYEALEPPQRAALGRAVDRATATQRERAAGQDAAALDELLVRGVKVLGPEQIDLAAMHAATRAVSARQRSTLAPELLAAYLPALH